MISHHIPYRVAVRPTAEATAFFPDGWATAGGRAHDEPLRVELHVAARCQRAGFDSGVVPPGARPRRLRWPLLLSDARPAGIGCGGQRVARRDRATDRQLSPLFRRAGESVD